MRLTEKQLKALEWFDKRDGAYNFYQHLVDPSPDMIRGLMVAGLIKQEPDQKLGYMRHYITDAGRAALSHKERIG